jgi:hypothetical protein
VAPAITVLAVFRNLRRSMFIRNPHEYTSDTFKARRILRVVTMQFKSSWSPRRR